MDAVIDRELVAPASTALTYLASELQIPVPANEWQRLLAQSREPFLGELAAYWRTYQNRNDAEARAIYQAEGIRSRKALKRRRQIRSRALRWKRRPKPNLPTCHCRRKPRCRCR